VNFLLEPNCFSVSGESSFDEKEKILACDVSILESI